MSDSDWRKAALALRNRSVTPKQFIEALGNDFELIFSLQLAAFDRRTEISHKVKCVCGHLMYLHKNYKLDCAGSYCKGAAKPTYGPCLCTKFEGV